MDKSVFQKIVEYATDAVVVTDAPAQGASEKETIIFVNEAYEKMTGYSKEEVIGKSPKILQGSESDKKELDKLRNALQSNQPGHAQLINYKKNGDKFWSSISIFPINNDTSDDKYWVGIKRDITEEKQDQEFIKISLREKETLLMEIHHRVKNNLAVISGLLELELYQGNGKTTKRFVRSSQLRIKSMAKIHEMLYQSESLSKISFKGYVEEFISAIQKTIQTERFNPQFTLNIDDIALNINQAIPCGLILNELISNSLEYAFPDREQGTIYVTLTRQDGDIYLSVEDDGIGVPEDFNFSKTQSLGITLIKILSNQLHADLHIGNSETGFKCLLTFEMKEVLKGSAGNIV